MIRETRAACSIGEAFQPEQLFMDADNIAPGLDFVRVLEA